MERQRRTMVEGPPDGIVYIVTDSVTGVKQKLKRGGTWWDNNNPCVQCNDQACRDQINELGGGAQDQLSLCLNPLNDPLLRMMSNWRRHVKDTFIETSQPGQSKWTRRSICTSELTFLGLKKTSGGLIPLLAETNQHICSIPTLVSLTKQGAKGLSCSLVMLIAMYMDGSGMLDRSIHPWDLYTEDNKTIIGRLVNKVRRNGKKGIDCYEATPFCIMFRCIEKREDS